MDKKKTRVLLIEDNPGDVRLMEEMLKEAGDDQFELKHADRLSLGQEYLLKGTLDVILLDLGLPESQGLPTLDKILSLASKVPIVVLTGSIADEMIGVKAVQKGAQDYLTKGQVDGPLLVRSIRYAIERKQGEEELRKQHEYLEYLNSKLTAVNKELEAFSYSVSHDLRAPLRRIDGFCKALMEDYEDKLDTRGKDYLQRVREASRLMGQLIEAMLNLSRITLRKVHYKAFDLSGLAKMVAKELQEMEPERQVEFVIAEGLIVHGDPHLLRAALQNLLDNAWKFSKKCARTRIEFGFTQHNGKPTYFVRDNGAGFDMASANKLFGPFQRLHSTTDFEGTGIGLATVQRIIHRHGGHIWAEGAVDKGATFYFTLT